MSLSIGQRVWIPCEVKPGPFSDQRMVNISSPAVDSAVSRWTGFVPITELREPIEYGSTSVAAIVINVLQDRFFAQPVGDPFANTLFEDRISRAEPIGSFKG